jgi:hypothetical protein
MKRKEAIKFLDSVAEYISGADGTITLFNPKSNESVELDTDLAFCFMGTPIVAMKDMLESDKLDDMTPDMFVHLMTKSACNAYAQQLTKR